MSSDCTNCGKQWNHHTGTYCEHCGEPKPADEIQEIVKEGEVLRHGR